MSTPNIYAESARRAKASKLADLFQIKAATSEQVASLDETGWQAAAQLAGVRLPSVETRQAVVSALQSREEVAAKYGHDPIGSFIASMPDEFGE